MNFQIIYTIMNTRIVSSIYIYIHVFTAIILDFREIHRYLGMFNVLLTVSKGDSTQHITKPAQVNAFRACQNNGFTLCNLFRLCH